MEVLHFQFASLCGSSFVVALREGWGDRRETDLGGASDFFPVGFFVCHVSMIMIFSEVRTKIQIVNMFLCLKASNDQ